MDITVPICPVCGAVNVKAGHIMGHGNKGISSPRKTEASRRNAKLGGWTKGRKRKPAIKPQD